MLEFIRSKSQGWFAWLIVIMITVPFALWGIHQYFGDGGEARVASVNGQEISQARLMQAYQAQRQRLQDMFGENFNPEMFPEERMKGQILEGMIQQELLVQAAGDAGLRISDQQLASLIREVPQFQRDGKFSQADYEQAVRSQGLSVAAFEERARREVVAQQLQVAVVGSEFVTQQESGALQQLRLQSRDVGYMVLSAARYEQEMNVGDDEVSRYYDENGVRFTIPEQVAVNYIELNAAAMASGVPVSDEEVRQRYDSQTANYRTPEERKARHILIRVAQKDDEQSVAAAQAQIEALLAQVRQGESFAELAKASSQDPGSAPQGGDLGFFGRGMMDPAFEAATFALKKGEVSEVVRSRFGFHIIQLEDVRGGIVKPLAEVRAQIAAEIRQEQADQRFYELAGKLGNLAYEHPESLDEASRQLGLPIQQSAFFARSGGEGIAAEAKVAAAAFSDGVLKDGNNSESIEVGEKHLVVVRLREHQPEKRRALEDVKSQIVAQLKREKAKAHAEEVATTLLGRLAKGEEPRVIAKEAGAEWRRVPQVARESGELPPAVLAQAFRMPRPVAPAVVTAKVAMPDGNQALVALFGVTTPPLAEGMGDSEAVRGQLQQSHAEAAFNALLSSVKAKATIKH